VFCFGKFFAIQQQKKGTNDPTKGFFEFSKTNSPYIDKKN
jgi:hypothetical protein